jgi:hypothetical protein
VQIDVDLELLGCATPSIDLNYALDAQQATLHNPILDRAEIGQTDVGGPTT